MTDAPLCRACGSPYESGQKFCGECGSSLAQPCPSCGTANGAALKFCVECGTALAATETREPESQPTAERRLVSVLFADLVGFTAAAEGRDAEETRELLSRYFDTSRAVIEQYGGTVEKFIGDAVMAVWGAPTASEDDPERCVRAALELVDVVRALGAEVELPALEIRCGVLTGEAAVTVAAEGQGMVAGDLVNSASRAQAEADPGTVFVGEATRRATEAAIAYADAGERKLKGKSEAVHLWRALRVVANRGGEGRSAGLEAPFVGRNRELRMVKDLFHASAAEGTAHLVLVTGIAGIGKSRLAWEFEKYVDGLAADVWWHRGRCLAYGEGVAYWALAEMVRGRANIRENEDSRKARRKLLETVAAHVPDPDERGWVEPRLAHLLGLEERATDRPEDLFAAWRLFFHRLSERGPVALVFEDLQWADAGLLDFIEYLLEWSPRSPLYVIGLARAELGERRPGFGATSRSFTTMTLGPLPHEAMDELLDGLAPGLPDDPRTAILERAEGVPLYAVETVRMLLDTGMLERSNGTYQVASDLGAMAVPETLHSLVASRLDLLGADERRLVQDAAVLGKTFECGALTALTGRPTAELEPILAGLVRKEVLFLEADPRSPERGQYGFLQDLVRHVAYETLAHRERRERHIVAARVLEEGWRGREQEIADVVASHYVTALELQPDAADAPELRGRARELLARAGERAGSLGARAEAAAMFSRAADLAEDPTEQGRLLHLAGNAAGAAGSNEEAEPKMRRAIELLEAAGEREAAAKATADLGLLEFREGRIDGGIERMEGALAVLTTDEPSAAVAHLAAQLGRFHFFGGDTNRAADHIDLALSAAEPLRLRPVIAQALLTAGIIAVRRGQPEHARALVRHGFDLALELDYPDALERGYANLAWLEEWHGNLVEAYRLVERSVELTHRLGDRPGEWFALGNLAEAAFELGRWDEVDALAARWTPDVGARAVGLFLAVAAIARHRGDHDASQRALEMVVPLRETSSVQDRGVAAVVEHESLMARAEAEEALARAEERLADTAFVQFRESLTFAVVDAALVLERVDRADELVRELEGRHVGELSVKHTALTKSNRALIAAATADDVTAEAHFTAAAASFREHGYVFRLAVTQVGHAEWLITVGRAEEARALADEATETLEAMRARPWLERAAAVAAKAPTAAR